MSGISTHVLDLASGRPAVGVPVVLERRQADGGWATLGQGQTDADGRKRDLVPQGGLTAGTYRLTFDVTAHFEARGTATFFTSIPIQFEIRDGAQHYHVPLLLSPFGYSTYRGS